MTSDEGRFSSAIEDYLKAIYACTRSGAAATTTELSGRLGVTSASVSSMLKRLDQDGLVEHERYRGVQLTEVGERRALNVLRRHRLLELFLVQELGVPWERVHDEAEVLEHAISEYLLEAIAVKLGDPDVDPHGDPIPRKDLSVTSIDTVPLAQMEPGSTGILVRVNDTNPDMLLHLTERQLGIGDQLKVLSQDPFRGPITVRAPAGELALAHDLALAMHVQLTSAP